MTTIWTTIRQIILLDILFPRYNINIILISGRDPYYEYSEIEYSEK